MMDRNENSGIAALLSRSDQLEALLAKKLNQIPTDEELKNKYGDASDLKNAKERMQILAVLEAVVELDRRRDQGPIDLDMPSSPVACVSQILRRFKHDAERLNNGKMAEHILKESDSDSTQCNSVTPQSRGDLILWLALISLWNETTCPGEFPTRRSVIEKAANALGKRVGTINTELSNFRAHKKRKKDQLAQYDQLRNLAQELANNDEPTSDPFTLLYPAVAALNDKL